jgi:Fur family iron response transcriptional regulator
MTTQESQVTRLRKAGLKPTRQRMALAELLFGGGDRHVTAEQLHRQAVTSGAAVSLATVYNRITAAGFLREVAVEGARTYFDTNTADHFHFYLERKGKLVDIACHDVTMEGLPAAPAGKYISRIDVIVRLGDR